MFSINRQGVEGNNFHHLVMDIFWFGLALPATARFLAVYALRVGASPQEIGFLAALPSLIVLLSASLSSWWAKRNPDAARAVLLPGMWFRFTFLLPAFTPFFPRELQPTWLILSVMLPAIPQGVASVMFVVMMRESVPTSQMTALLGRRNLSMNIAVIFSTLILGLWLTKAPYPHNYTAMFVVAFVFAMVSLWHLSRTRSIFVAPPVETTNQPKISPWHDRQFREVLLIAFLTHVVVFATPPIVTVYLFDYMGADEQFMAIFVMAELLAAAVVSMFVTSFAQKYGNRGIIAPAMLISGLSIAVIALAPSLEFTLIGAVLVGLSWTVASVGVFGYFSDKASTTHSTAYSRCYNQTIFFAMFVGPLVGTNLVSEHISIVAVLLIGASLRMVVGAFIHFQPHHMLASIRHLRFGWHRPVRARSH